MKSLIRLAITAVALWVAVQLVTGLSYDGATLGLLVVALIFGVVNGLIRPVVRFLTLPVIWLTLGLFTLVINALMLWLTGVISSSLGAGLTVAGFWPAFWGSIVISIVSVVLSMFVKDGD